MKIEFRWKLIGGVSDGTVFIVSHEQTQTNSVSYLFCTADSRYLERAYLEQPLISKWKSCPRLNMKIEQQVKKIVERSNFSSFPQYFPYSYIFKSPITYKFVKCGC